MQSLVKRYFSVLSLSSNISSNSFLTFFLSIFSQTTVKNFLLALWITNRFSKACSIVTSPVSLVFTKSLRFAFILRIVCFTSSILLIG